MAWGNLSTPNYRGKEESVECETTLDLHDFSCTINLDKVVFSSHRTFKGFGESLTFHSFCFIFDPLDHHISGVICHAGGHTR